MTAPTKAAAARWFAEHVGDRIDTVQRRPDGSESWRPGPRVLSARGAGAWELDGSTVRFGADHVVTAVGPDGFTVEWRDEGALIHSTTYSAAVTAAPIDNGPDAVTARRAMFAGFGWGVTA